MQIGRGGGRRPVAMASSANGLELQEMAEVSGQKPKQPETTETLIQAPLASICFDISPSSESSAEEDEESQIGGEEKRKLLKHTRKLELPEIAEVSGQKPKQPETTETQIQPPVASTSFDISPSSERNLESSAEKDSYSDKEFQTSQKWIKKNIKLRCDPCTAHQRGSWPADYSIQTNSKEEMYALDPNHSHFILVDDGTKDNFGEIIEFRKKLEHTISQEKIPETEVKIPAVAVMVGGGPGTLKSVHDSISRNIPVVIVKDTGRAADILADAYQTKLENSNEEDEDINDRNLKTDIREQIIKEFEKELKGKGIDNLVDYVLMSLKRPNLLTVYDKDSEKEFDLTMFKAVFKAKKNIENMRLGLEWNKPDVLKRLIFKGEAPREDVKKWIPENIKLRNLRDEEASNPCDAFGEVKFVEHDQKIAKFVRVDHQTPMDIIINLIIYQWNFSLPNLLISVIGGREDVQLNEPAKEALGHSLVKAARTTDAWIISEGLHSGVVKYIGEAISDNENKVADMKKVKTFGIARWNCVQNKESLVNKECKRINILQALFSCSKNHDSSCCSNGWRELETLKSAYDSLSRNISVIIVKGSGKAADIMADVYEALLKKDEEGKDITERSILRQLKADIEKQGGANDVHDLVDCVIDSMRYLDLITVCNIQSPEDFDIAIMKAVFKDIE
ncbi:Hypothetical predicted protein [Octopus vulgaris]|uniref:TRPM SLOG domain-containing protein n=1 Tax=Octopus vulgaris TaxID=6645 RepID=A0AA36BK88_OCTVU|nr:Hypothetical predicted protein [Octopus vulgaris]